MRENDIYGHVIQNAKDIQTLSTNMDVQNQINKSHSTAGILTSISVMLLGVCTWVITSAVEDIQKRLKKLEEEKSTIDIHPEE